MTCTNPKCGDCGDHPHVIPVTAVAELPADDAILVLSNVANDLATVISAVRSGVPVEVAMRRCKTITWAADGTPLAVV